ncbi:serine/threonine protein kinase, partial [bacterium]|nr:serine/threonine protein kinase [bacterium]
LTEARKLRNYRLTERLGRGGMGEVWRAEHAVLPRPAAIKFISPEALGERSGESEEETRQRFLAEARATVRLSSPHTIEIYDFGTTADGMLCYVMEYLDGMDLETLVKRWGPMPPHRAVYLLRQVCISLAEAHQQSFVHRDIKPANIFVCRKGIHYDFVKVLDFGLAAESCLGNGKKVRIAGTPTCVAPETVNGAAFDARTDIYSLGCVAYWLLTGRTVFDAETPMEMVSHHVHTRPVPPSQRLGRELPRDLELLVLHCLNKHADDRVQSVAEFSRRLAGSDVGAVWTPGQAMTWWHARKKEMAAPAPTVDVALPSTPHRRSMETTVLHG